MKVPDEFVDELAALYRKWGIAVTSCGCCDAFTTMCGSRRYTDQGGHPGPIGDAGELAENLRGSEIEWSEHYPDWRPGGSR